MVFQGRWDYPQRWIKVLLVVASAIGVGASGQSVFSLETATGLLIVAFALKLVEMKSRRDAYLVIHLCYFIVAAEFLFDQSIGIALYSVLSMVIVTAALVGLHQLHTRVRVSLSLRTAAVLVMQAMPLMLVLFLFFPRVAPLWSVPLPGGTRTGMSDHVAPGDIAALTRSDEIAFRAVFDGPTPPVRDLYWRGLVYSNFSQGTWSVGGVAAAPENAPAGAGVRADFMPDVSGIEPVLYQILLEPTQQSWLFALDVAIPVGQGISLTRDFRLISAEPVHTMMRYRGASYPGASMDLHLPAWLRIRETRLPDDDNPRIIAFAKDLAAESDGDEDFLARVLQFIRVQQFFYTLSPPLLSDTNSVDAFWFDSRRGFCSHFAGAFVYMARAVGIPARMVGGYQGGEVNPLTGHLVVRQFDAHAWTEVWLEGRGWVRFDPTAAVAPARIESGLNAALSEADREVLSSVTGTRFEGVPGLRDVVYLFESMQHRWNLWVVGYDTEVQARYLADLLGKVTPTRVGIAMLLGGGVSLALVVVSLFWRRRPDAGSPCATDIPPICTAARAQRTDACAARNACSLSDARECGAQSRARRHCTAHRSSRFAPLQSRCRLQQGRIAYAAHRIASVAGRRDASRALKPGWNSCRDSCDQRRASAYARRRMAILFAADANASPMRSLLGTCTRKISANGSGRGCICCVIRRRRCSSRYRTNRCCATRLGPRGSSYPHRHLR